MLVPKRANCFKYTRFDRSSLVTHIMTPRCRSGSHTQFLLLRETNIKLKTQRAGHCVMCASRDASHRAPRTFAHIRMTLNYACDHQRHVSQTRALRAAISVKRVLSQLAGIGRTPRLRCTPHVSYVCYSPQKCAP